MNMFDLSGKVAIITGSTRGIGKAGAFAMAQMGAKIVVSSRNQEMCDEVANDLNKEFGENTAIAIAANISSKEALQNLVAKTIEKFGKIDALVCNAATNPYYGPMTGISDEQFFKILQNNIVSNNWLVQFAVPHMPENSSIIIVSSVGGLRGSDVIGAYNISKAADMQLARNLAVELGTKKIRCNCINPGVIRTDFARALWDDPAREKAISRGTPTGRLGEPEDIGGVIAFLASKASAFINGEAIVVDGGMTIRSGNF